MNSRTENVEVDDGAVPLHVLGPEDAGNVPGLVVVPSIYGPAPDLLRQMSELADGAFIAVTDPFWREGGGVVPYGDHDAAIARLRGFDRDRCFRDIRRVIDWTRERCNGSVVGLGICFGGPIVLVAAGEGALSGVMAWHGSRMENFLENADQITCPLRFHFGSDDPVTPPEAIETIREAFAAHPDTLFVVHPGLVHGFSHEGSSYDAAAAQSGVDDLRALLADQDG